MSVDETDEERPDRPDIVELLPRYGLVRQLSGTLMSEVFRARDRVLDVDVALKVIRPDLMRQVTFATRFKRETRIAAALRHPNIVPVYDTGVVGTGDEQLGYLSMRFVDGPTLGRVIAERGRLGLDETVEVARQVAGALDAAHAQGLVHRDVKPANILVETATNQYFLCDFGIAKSVSESTVTGTGAVVGSALYWSPEQQTGSRDIDHRSDVYSLACVLYDCLAGLAPSALRAERANRDATRSPAVDRVLRRAMSTDPAQRHGSCGALADDLAEAVRETHRRRRLVTVARRGAVGSVAVLALLAFLVIPGQSRDSDDLTRIPTALRDDCQDASTSRPAGASRTLSCTDGAGHTVVTSLFPTGDAASAGYRQAVDTAGVDRSQGDCARGEGGEHRYPATGSPRGRVACQQGDDGLTLVWLDERNRTVSRSDATDADGLRRAWSRWTGGDAAFPTAAERALVDLAAGTTCSRTPAADLDAFPAATAAVTCEPRGSGARSVTYFTFSSRTALRDDLAARVKAADADSGEGCAGSGRTFLGTGRHDWLGVDLGQVLCQSGTDGTVRMDWSMEPLLVAGSVKGVDRASLTGWWSQWHLAPLSRVVTAMNAQSSPPFPTKAERALLAHIPKVSRINCVRTPDEAVWRDLGAAEVTSIVCGPTSGARRVVYYAFPDAAAMRAAYNDSGRGGGSANCTSPSGSFDGSGSYSRGSRSGRIRCGQVGGERYLEWTDNRRAIAVFAHDGRQPAAMVDWWRHDAGPV